MTLFYPGYTKQPKKQPENVVFVTECKNIKGGVFFLQMCNHIHFYILKKIECETLLNSFTFYDI